MAVLALTQTTAAVTSNTQISFQGVGGTAPYTYSVLASGAGGTINVNTGVYMSPAQVSTMIAYVAGAPLPATLYDVVQVADSAGAKATTTVLVGTPLMLLCDILQTSLGLPDGRVYLWDQKIMQPTDSALYIAVSMPMNRVIGSSNAQSADGTMQEQFVAMQGTVDLDIISRGPAARDQKEFVVLALNSQYSIEQQITNSFHIGRVSTNFVNLSQVDGAALPYRYKVSFNIQYAVAAFTPAPYFDEFATPSVTTNP